MCKRELHWYSFLAFIVGLQPFSQWGEKIETPHSIYWRYEYLIIAPSSWVLVRPNQGSTKVTLEQYLGLDREMTPKGRRGLDAPWLVALMLNIAPPKTSSQPCPPTFCKAEWFSNLVGCTSSPCSLRPYWKPDFDTRGGSLEDLKVTSPAFPVCVCLQQHQRRHGEWTRLHRGGDELHGLGWTGSCTIFAFHRRPERWVGSAISCNIDSLFFGWFLFVIQFHQLIYSKDWEMPLEFEETIFFEGDLVVLRVEDLLIHTFHLITRGLRS